MTLRDLMSRFSDEDCCRDLLERLRWPVAPRELRGRTQESEKLINGIREAKRG